MKKLPTFLTAKRPSMRPKPTVVDPPVRELPMHSFIPKLVRRDEPVRLTPERLYEIASSIDVPRANLLALFRQESGGRGFELHEDGTWRPKIRLELHKLNQFTNGMFASERPDLFKTKLNIKDSNAPQHEQWRRFNEALGIVEGYFGRDPVIKATGWGIGQVQGFNYLLAGSGTAERFAMRMLSGEEEQMRAVTTFVENAGIRGFLADGDWVSFAKHYNGIARYRQYAEEIERHYMVVSGRMV